MRGLAALQMGMGCFLVWVAHDILVQTITNFVANQFKWTGVAFWCGLLMSFRVKPVQMDMGSSLVWGAHVILDQTIANGYGLLFSMGCSCYFGPNHYKWA